MCVGISETKLCPAGG